MSDMTLRAWSRKAYHPTASRLCVQSWTKRWKLTVPRWFGAIGEDGLNEFFSHRVKFSVLRERQSTGNERSPCIPSVGVRKWNAWLVSKGTLSCTNRVSFSMWKWAVWVGVGGWVWTFERVRWFLIEYRWALGVACVRTRACPIVRTVIANLNTDFLTIVVGLRSVRVVRSNVVTFGFFVCFAWASLFVD